MRRRELAAPVVLGAFLCACGSPADGSGETKATGSTTTSTGNTTTSTGSTTTSTTAGSTGDAPTSSESGNFVHMPDLPAPGAPCDPWQDSCPPGQKCKPYAEGLGPWTAASCVPVADPPTPTGDACTDPEWSVVDDCERGAVCHGFLGESLRCHELCSGSPMAPTCSDACSWCVKNGDVAGVCLFPCDPRAFACPEGQRCEILVTAPRFECTPGPGSSVAGEACMSSSQCTDGTACIEAALVPGCAGDRCCAPVCDTGGPDGCAAILPGTVCAPWPVSGPDFEASCLPPGLGLCVAA